MMKFVLLLALFALYWATPTLGLKCYQCVPGSEVDCEAFDKMSVADRKAKATNDCKGQESQPSPICLTLTPKDSKDKKEVRKGCFREQFDNNTKLEDGKCQVTKGKDYNVCACKTDYCNTASFSRSPPIYMLGFAVVVTFLNAKMNAR